MSSMPAELEFAWRGRPPRSTVRTKYGLSEPVSTDFQGGDALVAAMHVTE